MTVRSRPATHSVFVNCPFDEDYKELFDVLIFAVHDCGFYVRCALESRDSGEIRFQKICQLIRQCRYGIHDLSRTQLDSANQLPRFNMPLELGLFLGAKEFGQTRRLRKVCLVLDTEQFRYQKFCSDLAGVDIEAHDNQPRNLVRVVRNWLQANQGRSSPRARPMIIPDWSVIFQRYQEFLETLPYLCREHRLNYRELQFPEYVVLIEAWLREHDWRPTM